MNIALWLETLPSMEFAELRLKIKENIDLGRKREAVALAAIRDRKVHEIVHAHARENLLKERMDAIQGKHKIRQYAEKGEWAKIVTIATQLAKETEQKERLRAALESLEKVKDALDNLA